MTAVEKEQGHALVCKLTMQMVQSLRCQAGMLHLKDSIQAWLYPSTSIERSTITLRLWENGGYFQQFWAIHSCIVISLAKYFM